MDNKRRQVSSSARTMASSQPLPENHEVGGDRGNLEKLLFCPLPAARPPRSVSHLRALLRPRGPDGGEAGCGWPPAGQTRVLRDTSLGARVPVTRARPFSLLRPGWALSFPSPQPPPPTPSGGMAPPRHPATRPFTNALKHLTALTSPPQSRSRVWEAAMLFPYLSQAGLPGREGGREAGRPAALESRRCRAHRRLRPFSLPALSPPPEAGTAGRGGRACAPRVEPLG